MTVLESVQEEEMKMLAPLILIMDPDCKPSSYINPETFMADGAELLRHKLPVFPSVPAED